MKEKMSPQTTVVFRNIIAAFIEETGADGVIVGLTRHRKNETETYVVPYGNIHCIRGLAEHVYEKLCDELEEEEEDDMDKGNLNDPEPEPEE